ncbi:HNH endonuclease [Kitasatospora sp. NPDC127067]|uniref:HNH endonuclease n=1 Tax=Kitasatospora sp. NPDC127067 TaxID=3347126 RepID=UPI00365992FA
MGTEGPSRHLRWDDESLGVRKRVALWLSREVGDGNVFTMDQLREAFPGVAQLDRRLRDLRNDGWVIDTARSDSSLHPNEMRFAARGLPVWESSVRFPRRGSALRDEVLKRDGFACTHCGLSVAEAPSSAPAEVVLEVAHITSLAAGGSGGLENMITLCANCHRLLDHAKPVDPDSVLQQVDDLSEDERSLLLAWMVLDQRPFSPVERAWAAYRRLRPAERKAVTRRVAEAVRDQIPLYGGT